MKIYTKQGDAGDTSLFDGTRVAKTHARIQTYGTMDELNSHLGLALVDCNYPDLSTILVNLQYQLFEVGSDLATPADAGNARKIRRVQEADIIGLEQHIDRITALLPPLKRFILPGGGITAARLHVARTVCRRAERLLVALMAEEPSIAPATLIYLNRLSDLLFVLARYGNHLDQIADVEWKAAGL